MKSIFKWTLYLTVTTFTVAGIGTSCNSKDDDNPPTNILTLSGDANSTQEVPTFTSTATGTLTGTYDKDANKLTYSITWNGISAPPVGFHFHGPADPGANASVVVPITGYPAATSGTYAGSATLTEAQEAELLAGKWYYNIHTPAKTGGEIRGQVTAK